jgi:nucleotide sugar dehydrogenase
MDNKNIGVIGIGRLGLSFALLAEKQGYYVIGCDNRVEYLGSLAIKEIQSSEPFITDYLQHSAKFTVTPELSAVVRNCDTLFCFVATPSLPDGSYDHSAVDDVVNQLQELHVRGMDMSNKLLVIGCTVMPGYTASITERLTDTGIKVAYNPEFIAQGSIIDGLRNADMVLMGVTEDSTYHALQAIYRTIMNKEPVISRMSPTAAEITKISINCFLTMKIAYANMIGEIAINSGLEPEIPLILQAIGSDTRIGHKYLGYGFGYGGPCLPRDMRALGVYMEDCGIKARIPSATDNTNDAHARYLMEYYMKQNPHKDFPFQFTQLTYKKGVDMLTESQQYKLCKDLLYAGYSVAIDESDNVIQQIKPELQQYGDKVIYGTIDNSYKIDI